MKLAGAFVLASVSVSMWACGTTPSVPWQSVKDNLELRPIELHRTTKWNMFGSAPETPGSPSATAEPGHEFVVVAYEVRDAATQKIDSSASFSGFSAEDGAANRYPSVVESTDLREVAFSVPTGTRLAKLTVEGKTFDIGQLKEKT